jgi:hypothetical protein
VRVSSASFVVDALAILENESPAAYAAITRLLYECPCRCVLYDERFELRGVDGRVEVSHEVTGRQRVTVATNAAAIVRLLDGTAMLEGLLASEELRIAGDADGLIALAAISETAIAGGLRSLPMLALFERFRDHVADLRDGVH